MNIAAGAIIKSLDTEEDDFFFRALVFITSHNQQGSTGFIFNRIFGRSLNELEAYKHSKPLPLFEGGPVAADQLFFIHHYPELIGGGTPITGDMRLGGDFDTAVQFLNRPDARQSGKLKIFIGYCGWDAGELAAEIAAGGWELTDYPLDKIFF
ncbi:MAG: YqgE/AlgH family protein [Chitinophagaceae bacterium]|nr:MAG: YqgE/AlgH family protein [Chitinophagaceae bacterium]